MKPTISEELKQKLYNNEEVDIRFRVHEGLIEESVCLASMNSFEGFLTYMFEEMLSGGIDSDDIIFMCSIAISRAQKLLEQKEEKTGGIN